MCRCSARCGANGASWSVAKPYRISRQTFIRQRELEIFQAQHFVVVVVGEDLRVSSPVDNGREHPIGFLLRQVIFEFPQEAGGRRAMARTLVEHPPYMRRQWDVLQQGGRK